MIAMHSNHQSATHRGTTLAQASLLTVVLILGGCGGNSGLPGRAGGTTSAAAGGDGGSQRTAGASGEAGASGGAQGGTPLGTPFVAVADGVRIYLGTFTAGLSSIPPIGPWAEVEEITSDEFVLHAPMTGSDLRNDERIIKALSERGKLVP